jgi:hypothetical protein
LTTTSKPNALDKVVTGLELLTVGLALGATIYSLFEEATKSKSRTKPAPKATASPTTANEALRLGKDLLSRNKLTEGQSLREFLEQKYHGLWLIGRSGHFIKENEKDALAAELRHLHSQLFQVTGHDTDRALTEWYETVGVGKRIQLLDLYLKSPTVDNAFNATRYAASAFTGTIDQSLNYELSADEWVQIKRHLGVE